MTAKPPSGDEPQPVPGHPGWFWWRGVGGMLYARRPRTSPPRVVRAHNFTALLGCIVKSELGRLRAGYPGWAFGTVERSEPPGGRNLTAQRGGVLLAAPDAAMLAEKIRHEERQT